MGGQLFLEIGEGHTLWALESEIQDYMEQLQDYPRGDCLEIGLGLGVVSRYLLSFYRVKSLTTVEVNKDVIEVHEKINPEDRGLDVEYDEGRHTILNADGISYAYQTNKRYDFIFMDFYDRIDEETLPVIADMAHACSRILKPGGRMMGWWDKHTPEPHDHTFMEIFDNY
jgi:spermidine synthase